MFINCFYAECEEIADIIYVPDFVTDIEGIQERFFEWMFDKNVDHKYWVVSMGKKEDVNMVRRRLWIG